MRVKLLAILMLALAFPMMAQTGVKGTLVDSRTGKGVEGANVLLSGQGLYVMSGADGVFTISNAKAGTDVLEILAEGYADKYIDVDIKEGIVRDLGKIQLELSGINASNLNTDDFVFDEAVVLEDEGADQSVGTIQGARDDVYYQTANYNFSVMRFRIRGYEPSWNAGYINGFKFNDAMRGRFNYSGLGGMTSSAFRNKTVDPGVSAASYGFGSLGGATNFTTYASEYAPGFRGNISYTNSNYMLRAMLQYNTGLLKNGWAVSMSIIGRYAPQGVIEGTFYNSIGYALSVQKIFNEHHSLNLSTWGAPTQRATNSAATQEAYDLAGSNLYNPGWGYLDGKKKSARVVDTFSPSALLNWVWKPKMGTTVNTGIGFQMNRYANSALNWYQAADPRPDYYRYLPSYYNPNNEWGQYYVAPEDRQMMNEFGEMVNTPVYDAYLNNWEMYQDLWRNDKSLRQINWDALYQTNLQNRTSFDRDPSLVGHSTYILEKRHSNFMSWMFNSFIDHRLSDYMTLQGGISFNYTNGNWYKTIKNLLGGEYWRDVDNFSERDFPGNTDILQNDLNHPNRKVYEGDRFGYDYNILSYVANAWIQNQINTTHWNVNYGIDISYTSFFRDGKMRNGRAPENSYGPGTRHNFDNASIKAGATYKLNGRNYFVIHGAFGTRAPLPDNSYISPRTKDTSMTGLKSERFLSGDISYVWNYSRFRGSITGFYTHIWDATKRCPGFYDYQLNTFMNYSMSGVETEYKGVELGLAYKIIPSLTLSAAGTFSRYQYKNNPLGVRSYENGAMDDVTRRVYLKNYYLGGTPQQAYSIGLDWAAPHQWFIGLNANWFGDNYIDLAPSRHEEMPELYTVVTPAPGQTMEQAIGEKIEEITHQDKLKNAFVLNFSIGKVVYTNFGSLNFNVSVNNLLNNRNIQTGGYQEGKFDYTNYSVNKFPNKYYYAQGIRVFVNIGIRF
ncbi:MAG: carboxypeptidase-like regulatory domain-containing protein [Muribaculaceae bacterium]|nr:carboxypeptidase-like regulatory domain-containing protein [Muribaculaceae bacterium]